MLIKQVKIDTNARLGRYNERRRRDNGTGAKRQRKGQRKKKKKQRNGSHSRRRRGWVGGYNRGVQRNGIQP